MSEKHEKHEPQHSENNLPSQPSEESQKWSLATARWTASDPTGAFDSSTVSFRYMPKAYNWAEVLGTVGVLYGVFIGLPALAGTWAVFKIGQGVGWW